MKMNKKTLIIVAAVVVVLAVVLVVLLAGGKKDQTPVTPENPAPVEKEFKLGMGIVVSLDSSASYNVAESKAGVAQFDATVATVVLDAQGKIVVCRLDAVQNKAELNNNGTYTVKNLLTKMELGDDYNMAKYGQNMDWNGDKIVKEWYDQAKAFENYVIGMTADEVAAMPTKVVEGSGYIISAEDALLNAGCTIQITDFKEAVVKACKDEQGTSFKTNGTITLGVAANSFVEIDEVKNDKTTIATADKNGAMHIYSDFAASAVVGGKIVASLNDAIQPSITFDVNGNIVAKSFKATKRELMEDYNMAKYGQSMDWNGDKVVKEWYLQSAAFSAYVVGMTKAQVEAMPTKVVEGSGYIISAEDALLNAGCTIQITDIKAVVAESITNAR